MLTVYGIKNCNTMKKAFDFLTQHNKEYQFFDYKKQVLSFEDFCRFIEHFGMDKVINKQGTTYKKFADDDKAIIASGDVQTVYELVKNHQSVIKRPIVLGEYQGKDIALIGFDEAAWQSVFLG